MVMKGQKYLNKIKNIYFIFVYIYINKNKNTNIKGLR